MSRVEFELATDAGRGLLGARDDVDVWFEAAPAKISFECSLEDDESVRSSFFFLLEKRPLIRELMFVCECVCVSMRRKKKRETGWNAMAKDGADERMDQIEGRRRGDGEDDVVVQRSEWCQGGRKKDGRKEGKRQDWIGTGLSGNKRENER